MEGTYNWGIEKMNQVNLTFYEANEYARDERERTGKIWGCGLRMLFFLELLVRNIDVSD